MNENTTVKCPKCGEVFKVDDTVYNNIVKQVRDQEFQQELSNRLATAEKEKESALELVEQKLQNSFQQELSKKQQEIDALKLRSKSELVDQVSKKEDVIRDLKSKLENAETAKKLALSEAVKEIEKERDQLKNNLKVKDTEKELLEKSLNEEFQNNLRLKEATIKLRDEEIERLKDFKQKLSTKMLGETLEQHCEIEFNKLRATAFQKAHFEKDNDASSGTKGDYIFREEDEQGNEIVSIMFEMKNENDQTATKKKNEDFFAKLDKDRREKGCEYAVLVSLLESDNEYYNTGIVDVSHRYEKMYVIRPQFFIPMITVLKNAGMNSLTYKQELSVIRNQNMDITNFEDKIQKFRDGFSKNYLSAASHFEKAIEEIDKSIARMQKVKQELTTTGNQLRLANNKAQDLTIKKLTYNNPTMKQKFNDLKNKSND